MIRNLAINEILHLPLKELEARLRSGDYYIDHRGMGRKDRRIIKKGAPEYGICRWEFSGRVKKDNGYILNIYRRLYDKYEEEERLACLVFSSTFGVVYLSTVWYVWEEYEINKDWSISDYIKYTE